MPKREILERFSSAELQELLAFREIEPWGGEWENIRAGTVATAAAGSNPNRKPCDVPKPGDWFAKTRRTGRRQAKLDRAVMDRAAVKFQRWREKNKG